MSLDLSHPSNNQSITMSEDNTERIVGINDDSGREDLSGTALTSSVNRTNIAIHDPSCTFFHSSYASRHSLACRRRRGITPIGSK